MTQVGSPNHFEREVSLVFHHLFFAFCSSFRPRGGNCRTWWAEEIWRLNFAWRVNCWIAASYLMWMLIVGSEKLNRFAQWLESDAKRS